MSKKYLFVSACAAALVGLLARDAHADGLVIAPSKLAPAARTSLSKEISSAKTAHAAVRAKVRDVQSVKPEVYKKRQNPVPEASRELRVLGQDALVPMLEALAFEASQPGLSAVEEEALSVGMISAVGDLRDARSFPVLSVIFETASSEPIAAAAAVALGKRCSADELGLLQTNAAEGKKLRLAAIAGLGQCRKNEAAQTLVTALGSNDQAVKKATITALGTLGSSWALATKGDEAEATKLRNLTGDAVLKALVKTSSVRTEAKRAYLKIEPTNALERVRAAKKDADAGAVKELEALERIFERRAARK